MAQATDRRWIPDAAGSQLIAAAHDARRALLAFIPLFWAEYGSKRGMSLATTDQLVSTVEDFVRTYRKMYGNEVR